LPQLQAILRAPPKSQQAIDTAVTLLTRSYIGTHAPPLELTLTTPRGKAPQAMEAVGQ
jgi:hypothetical protein